MGVSSFWQLVVKGLIILAAVILDSRKEALSEKLKKKKIQTKEETENGDF